MDLPAVRAPRLSWSRRLTNRLFQRYSLPEAPSPTAYKRFMTTHTAPLSGFSDESPSPHSVSTDDTPTTTPSSSTSSISRHKRHSHSFFHRRTAQVDRSRQVMLPHTITERQGGRDLWVTAPVISDELEKQGFRWRKKWKTRFVELNGRSISYYELSSSCSTKSSDAKDSTSRRGVKPRMSVYLSADALLEDIDDVTFAITPAMGERPWVLRARDAATKRKWCKAIFDCIDILNWLRHYTVGDVLGVGGNGVVRRLVDNRSGQEYAVKIIDAAKFRNRAAVVSEVEILRNITNDIRHPNLVKIHKVYEEQGKIYLVLDMCTGGELYDSIVSRGHYNEADAAKIMSQLMSALQALHKHNILHLDVKPENILLSSKDSSNAKIILTDFGLARMVNGKQNPLEAGKTMAGTIGYIAPEVIAAHQYTEAADVFSAGVILFILLVGYPPFTGDSEIETLLKIARGDFQFHAADWKHVSRPAMELVAKMLEVRPQDRITVDEVLQHPWIQNHEPNDETHTLNHTVERMQQFNFLRKTENMASCMATMLGETNEEDYLALMDVQAIDSMIRQLTPSGNDRMVVDKATIMARALGLSPHVDVQLFVLFLDHDHDGFINAPDFCNGVKAMREGHESFAKVVFAALVKMANSDAAALTLSGLRGALDELKCPESLVDALFKYLAEHPEETGAGLDSIGETEFAPLLPKFRFLGHLFLVKARDNVMAIARSATSNELPEIAEEIRESLMQADLSP
ncbi:hypothetical protein Poli38472_012843 [Pythium oligandrum]|uniref:Calmodulin n=1 Tax=Pythium oligandrum TaxID=41045 RepID=A0A8K1CII2_PYTOL|nr:hypothetical protein Poli38472_012843 [Pythium oligandrum]|eukprot:TMW64221.1 hypothetical protein Poli38472_012843 [Pythium oligandrum]